MLSGGRPAVRTATTSTDRPLLRNVGREVENRPDVCAVQQMEHNGEPQ